ncbi:MAG: MFS transporter [Gammaproteobacteria bacterium]|nr:MFS transporter [Gammaproteobacteria bacterium]
MDTQSPYKRRETISWALYDWANSAFATTVLAGFFPVFFQKFWSTGVDPTVSTSRLGFANGLAGLLVAVLAPILGTIADRTASRKRQLVIWTTVGVIGTAALGFIGQGEWWWAAACFMMGCIGFNAGNIFNDSLLLDVAAEHELDQVSALGYSLGYLGGGLLFAINVLMTLKPQWFGLADVAASVQASFVMAAGWWFLFMLPAAINVRERAAVSQASGVLNAAREGLRELRGTLRDVGKYRDITLFLLAYWLYIDGVHTIYTMAVDYGVALGLPSSSLLAALLLTQFVAFPSALALGGLGNRWGPKRGILLCIIVYLSATIYAYFLDTVTEFFALAVAVGLVQGGIQSLSRSMFGRLVPPGKSGEFFGFFNMMGKFASFLGPMLIGTVALLTDDSRLSVSSIIVLFIFGGLVLLRVPGR